MHASVTSCIIFLLALCLPAVSSSAQERTTGAVVFDGVSVFGPAQLLPLYMESLGKTPDTRLKTRLATRTRDYYISQGYLAPAVSITDHPDSENILLVLVEEPQVDDVQVAGGSSGQQSAVRERLTPLLERPSVSRKDIDRFARALEQGIGVGLNTHIVETVPGRHRVTLTIAPQVRGELTYSAEGSQSLGQHMVAGKVSVIGPGAGLNEVYLSGLHTIESGGYRNMGAGLSLPSSERDTVYADISASRAVPQDNNASPSRVYRRIWARLMWQHELIESNDLSLALDGSLILRDYTRERGSETEVDERLRMANARALAYVKGVNSTSRFGLAGRVGVDALGAERSGTGANDALDLDFQIIDARYTFWYGLPADFSLKLDVAGQYSDDNLPYSQRFSVGGSQFARAYEPGEFSGDSGIGSKLELRRGFNSDRWIQGARWVPYIYYGIATAHENETSENSSGAASGIGLRMLTREVSAYIELGKPLTAESEYLSKDPRLTGRLTVYF
ncbi:ShlB/FhaC/HecB family hemolysin secretion/activation protein [Marinobacter sediminicola]|uniref:ShlB/FhaC/HecB family hemolysin secretion/activation protein n=1 Tax=Marinobacter sediminicola TaxID=3072994 RepID=UPI0028110B1D|nr:ShlB/FhaC/HecB family hemolysin secretion/activation protein [Marinobacter sp. F26243]